MSRFRKQESPTKDPNERSSNIGLACNMIYILDDNNQPMPTGEITLFYYNDYGILCNIKSKWPTGISQSGFLIPWSIIASAGASPENYEEKFSVWEQNLIDIKEKIEKTGRNTTNLDNYIALGRKKATAEGGMGIFVTFDLDAGKATVKSLISTALQAKKSEVTMKSVASQHPVPFPPMSNISPNNIKKYAKAVFNGQIKEVLDQINPLKKIESISEPLSMDTMQKTKYNIPGNSTRMPLCSPYSKDGPEVIATDTGFYTINAGNKTYIMLDAENSRITFSAKTVDINTPNLRWNGCPLNDNLVSEEIVDIGYGNKLSMHELYARQEAINGTTMEMLMPNVVNMVKEMGFIFGGATDTPEKLNAVIRGIGSYERAYFTDVTATLPTPKSRDAKTSVYNRGPFSSGDENSDVPKTLTSITSKTFGTGADQIPSGITTEMQKLEISNIIDAPHEGGHPFVSALNTNFEATKTWAELVNKHVHQIRETGAKLISPGEMSTYPIQEVFKSKKFELIRTLWESKTFVRDWVPQKVFKL